MTDNSIYLQLEISSSLVYPWLQQPPCSFLVSYTLKMGMKQLMNIMKVFVKLNGLWIIL